MNPGNLGEKLMCNHFVMFFVPPEYQPSKICKVELLNIFLVGLSSYIATWSFRLVDPLVLISHLEKIYIFGSIVSLTHVIANKSIKG